MHYSLYIIFKHDYILCQYFFNSCILNDYYIPYFFEGNFCENSGIKKGKGRYKSLDMDKKTKYGGKIPIIIPDDIERAVGSGFRDFVNYCGLIMRSTISFKDGDWNAIIAKCG